MADQTAVAPVSFTVRRRGKRYARMQFQSVLERLADLEKRIEELESKKAPKKESVPKKASEQVKETVSIQDEPKPQKKRRGRPPKVDQDTPKIKQEGDGDA